MRATLPTGVQQWRRARVRNRSGTLRSGGNGLRCVGDAQPVGARQANVVRSACGNALGLRLPLDDRWLQRLWDGGLRHASGSLRDSFCNALVEPVIPWASLAALPFALS